MKKLIFLIVYFSSELISSEFYQYDNGWCYRGKELTRIRDVLMIVRDNIELQDTRSIAEAKFRDIFNEQYGESTERSNTAFAWTQACFKRTTNLREGIAREIGWIEKIQNEGKEKGKNLGIHLVHRPSNWSWFNWIWNRFKEEKQSKDAADRKENKTWEVDRVVF